MAYAREIILMILTHIRFRMAKNRERDSFYTILGKTLVRISNHCTYMNTWDNFLKNNPKLKGLPIISIVFEDNGSTETNDSLVLSQNRRKPIVVNEYVFSCNGDGPFITEKDIKTIISDLRNISTTNTYTDNTFKSKYFKRVSVNPTSQNISIDKNEHQVFTPNSNNTNWGHGIDYVSENNKIKHIII